MRFRDTDCISPLFSHQVVNMAPDHLSFHVISFHLLPYYECFRRAVLFLHFLSHYNIFSSIYLNLIIQIAFFQSLLSAFPSQSSSNFFQKSIQSILNASQSFVCASAYYSYSYLLTFLLKFAQLTSNSYSALWNIFLFTVSFTSLSNHLPYNSDLFSQCSINLKKIF